MPGAALDERNAAETCIEVPDELVQLPGQASLGSKCGCQPTTSPAMEGPPVSSNVEDLVEQPRTIRLGLGAVGEPLGPLMPGAGFGAGCSGP